MSIPIVWRQLEPSSVCYSALCCCVHGLCCDSVLRPMFVGCRLKGKVVGVISPPRETLSRTPQSPPAVTPVNGVSPTVVTPCALTVSPGNKPAVVALDLPELDGMDTGCLSSGREEEVVEAPSTGGSGNKPSVIQKGQKKKVPKLPICEAAALDPSLYQYRVEVCDVSGTSVVELPGTSIR